MRYFLFTFKEFGMNAQYFVDKNGFTRDWVMGVLMGAMLLGGIGFLYYGKPLSGICWVLLVSSLFIVCHDIPEMKCKIRHFKDTMTTTSLNWRRVECKYDITTERLKMIGLLLFCTYTFGVSLYCLYLFWNTRI